MTVDGVPSGVTLVPAVGKPVALPALEAGSNDRKVLVIGVDGLRWDRLVNAEAPTLHGLMTAGLFATGTHESDSPAQTVSGPGWSTLATGTSPRHHGVVDNSFAGRRYERHPDFLTLAKRVKPELRTCAVLDWAPLAEMGTFGPAIDLRIEFDGDANGFYAEDGRVTDVATRVLAGTHPDIAFVYLGCVDEAGHRTGPLSDAYMARIGAADEMIRQLVDAVRNRSTYRDEQWLIIVTTDHGHRDEGGHGGPSEAERAVFVIAHGPGIASGQRGNGFRTVDVATTVLDFLNIEPDPAWQLEGRSLLRPS